VDQSASIIREAASLGVLVLRKDKRWSCRSKKARIMALEAPSSDDQSLFGS